MSRSAKTFAAQTEKGARQLSEIFEVTPQKEGPPKTKLLRVYDVAARETFEGKYDVFKDEPLGDPDTEAA